MAVYKYFWLSDNFCEGVLQKNKLNTAQRINASRLKACHYRFSHNHIFLNFIKPFNLALVYHNKKTMTMQNTWQHLYWRAGFGANWQDLTKASTTSLQAEVKRLIKQAQQTPQPIKVMEGTTPKFEQARAMDKSERQKIIKELRKNVFLLNLAWIKEMAQTNNLLLEKMTLFWHGHFACKQRNVYHAQIHLHTLRSHALGSFRKLLHAIAKDPAMINFLNNQQNKKNSPNENFAREVMELFSLGRGNYTEQDIKEAARAFTGWGVNGDEFMFRRIFHDFGSKTFFGKKGNFSGEEIIDIILAKKETAQFITQKIYHFFVSEHLPPARLSELSDIFYQTDYDIAALMEKIFTADWFYEEVNQGNRIKAPVELIAGMMRQLDLRFGNEKALIFIQKVLGQMLFDPPNVAGWKGGQAWIDSSTLMFRLRLPEIILKAAEIGIDDKEDDDVQNENLRANLKNITASINWESLQKNIKTKDTTDSYTFIEGFLLQKKPKINRNEVINHLKADDKLEQIQKITTWLLSMPEYQLC